MKKTKNNTTPNNINTKATKKIGNWNKYNKSLQERGNITLYISRKLITKTALAPKKTKLAGRPKKYSDDLILLILTVRTVYHLPLRQTTGFVAGFLSAIGVNWSLPDYSTLSRRMQKLEVDFCRDIRSKLNGQKLTLSLDSSGLKVYGEGEWKVRKHGCSYRRTWVETHIAVNDSRDILGLINTKSNVHDASQFKPLIRAVKHNLPAGVIDTVIGDGAYDVNEFYHYAEDEWFYFIAPPPKNATIRVTGGRRVGIKDQSGWEERNHIVSRIAEIGLESWKQEVGYHRRNIVENTFYRLKTIFGDKLRSRTVESQYTEQCIRASLINRYNRMGLPEYAG
jgi:hypothetical protein